MYAIPWQLWTLYDCLVEKYCESLDLDTLILLDLYLCVNPMNFKANM